MTVDLASPLGVGHDPAKPIKVEDYLALVLKVDPECGAFVHFIGSHILNLAFVTLTCITLACMTLTLTPAFGCCEL